jgi:hypothetical protein
MFSKFSTPSLHWGASEQHFASLRIVVLANLYNFSIKFGHLKDVELCIKYK